MGHLSTLDYGVIGLYLAVVIGVCIKVTRRSPDADELFLAGRSLGPVVVGFSLFASNISSTTLIGLPGAAWKDGISVANYEWMAGLVLVFTALFITPRLIGSKVTTFPELLERRFDARLRKYLSATSLFLSVVLDTAGSLYAGALVMMMFIPGLTLTPTCIALAVFAGLYTAAGGLRAVAYTDVLQAVVLLIGALILSIIVFGQFDYSWDKVVAAVPAEKLSLIRPLDDPVLPWLGTLIGVPILGFYYWTMNQYVSQRLLGARDAETAGRGALLAAALKLLPLFLMVMPGAMAVALFSDMDRPDNVFPRLVATFAPPGIAGLMLIGLMAAIMSSVDSALNSASTLVISDFVQPRHPHLDHQTLARWGRYTTLIMMAVAALWAPMIDNFPGLFAYLQQAFAYVTPPLVAVFALGWVWKPLSAKGALTGLVAGHLISALWFIATQLDWLSIHFTIVAGVLFALTIVIAVAVQLLLPIEDNEVSLRFFKERFPGMPRDVKWGAIIIVALTALMIIAFW